MISLGSKAPGSAVEQLPFKLLPLSLLLRPTPSDRVGRVNWVGGDVIEVKHKKNYIPFLAYTNRFSILLALFI